jgi:hypothetical protein
MILAVTVNTAEKSSGLFSRQNVAVWSTGSRIATVTFR